MQDYRHLDKDPVIDIVRSAFQQTGMDIDEVADKAFVHPRTIHNWLDGATRRPQNITVDCVLCILGITRAATWTETGKILRLSPLKVIQGGKGKKAAVG